MMVTTAFATTDTRNVPARAASSVPPTSASASSWSYHFSPSSCFPQENRNSQELSSRIPDDPIPLEAEGHGVPPAAHGHCGNHGMANRSVTPSSLSSSSNFLLFGSSRSKNNNCNHDNAAGTLSSHGQQRPCDVLTGFDFFQPGGRSSNERSIDHAATRRVSNNSHDALLPSDFKEISCGEEDDRIRLFSATAENRGTTAAPSTNKHLRVSSSWPPLSSNAISPRGAAWSTIEADEPILEFPDFEPLPISGNSFDICGSTSSGVAKTDRTAPALDLHRPGSSAWDNGLDLFDLEPTPIDMNRVKIVPRLDAKDLFRRHEQICSNYLYTTSSTETSRCKPIGAATTTGTAENKSGNGSPRPQSGVKNTRTASTARTNGGAHLKQREEPPGPQSQQHKRRLVRSSDVHLRQHKRSKRCNIAIAASKKAGHEEEGHESRPHLAAIGAGSNHSSSSSSVSSASSEHCDEEDHPRHDMQQQPLQGNHIRHHQEAQWEIRLGELICFREEHGHCAVPYTFKKFPQLAQWVKRQRYQFKLKSEGKHSTLTDRRQKILDDAEFVWDSHHALWEERFHELLEFKRQFGHCLVPSRHEPNPALAVWTKCQRRQYRLLQQGRQTNITDRRIERLDEVGFCWSPRRCA